MRSSEETKKASEEIFTHVQKFFGVLCEVIETFRPPEGYRDGVSGA